MQTLQEMEEELRGLKFQRRKIIDLLRYTDDQILAKRKAIEEIKHLSNSDTQETNAVSEDNTADTIE